MGVSGTMLSLRFSGQWSECAGCGACLLQVRRHPSGLPRFCELCAHFHVVRQLVASPRTCWACKGCGMDIYGEELCTECRGDGTLEGPMTHAEYEHAL